MYKVVTIISVAVFIVAMAVMVIAGGKKNSTKDS